MWQFLSTVNGFDLLLIMIIVSLGIRIAMLNRECEHYVGQIMNVSWELQDWKRSSQLLSKEIREIEDAEYQDPHLTNPSQCDCDDCWISHPSLCLCKECNF
jgi:DNA gyrase inhibitor GyrI